MNKQSLLKAIITFAVLVAGGIVLSVVGVSNTSGGDQIVVSTMGSALVGGSLAFFLIEMFRLDREK